VEETEFEGRSEGFEKAKDRGVDKESEGTEGDEGKGLGRRENGEAHNTTVSDQPRAAVVPVRRDLGAMKGKERHS